jgi:hypothetical protein
VRSTLPGNTALKSGREHIAASFRARRRLAAVLGTWLIVAPVAIYLTAIED